MVQLAHAAAIAFAVRAIAGPTAVEERGAHARNLLVSGLKPYKYLVPSELSDESYVLVADTTKQFEVPVHVRGKGTYKSLQVNIRGAQEPTATYYAHVPLLPVGSSGEGTEESISVTAGKGSKDWQVSKGKLIPKIYEANQGLYRENDPLQYSLTLGKADRESVQQDDQYARRRALRCLRPQYRGERVWIFSRISGRMHPRPSQRTFGLRWSMLGQEGGFRCRRTALRGPRREIY